MGTVAWQGPLELRHFPVIDLSKQGILNEQIVINERKQWGPPKPEPHPMPKRVGQNAWLMPEGMRWMSKREAVNEIHQIRKREILYLIDERKARPSRIAFVAAFAFLAWLIFCVGVNMVAR